MKDINLVRKLPTPTLKTSNSETKLSRPSSAKLKSRWHPKAVWRNVTKNVELYLVTVIPLLTREHFLTGLSPWVLSRIRRFKFVFIFCQFSGLLKLPHRILGRP